MKKIVMVILLLSFLGIQFIDVSNTNPPVIGEIQVSPEIRTVLKKSCYDCHSNETNWPWFSKVAPVSWYVIDKVDSARSYLNFSEWNKYNSRQRNKKLDDILKKVTADEMPLSYYTFLNPNATLDFNKKAIIKKWITTNDFWR